MKEKSHPAQKEIIRLFVKLGVIGFGGPAVHIAMMEDEVVRKKNWFSKQEFLDLVGTVNLIPGPNSTELTMLIGYRQAGWKGLVAAGLSFILPAVLITSLLAWFYQQYGNLPSIQPFIYGIQPAVLSVVAALMVSLIPRAVKTATLALMGIAVLALALAGVNQIILLFGAGLLAVLLTRIKRGNAATLATPLIAATAGTVTKAKIFWSFLKIGAILYGSGYVLFSFLDDEFVKTGIISRQLLTNAIAVGQFTPGPVFSSATFLGWQLGGPGGALAATIGIFLPSFVLVALTKPLFSRLRNSPAMSAFLDAVNVASLALILVVCIHMGIAAITDWRTILIGIAGLLISLVFRKLNSAAIVVGGALAGYLLSMI